MKIDTAVVIAYAALVISIVSTMAAWQAMRQAKRQADLAEAAVTHAHESAHSSTVSHFWDRFFDLVRNGMRFEDSDWATQYWRLQHTEFYFFDNGWLPRFMYELWMVDLVECYRTIPEAQPSHERHMARYSVHNDELIDFFRGIAKFAGDDFSDVPARNIAIRSYVQNHRMYSHRRAVT